MNKADQAYCKGEIKKYLEMPEGIERETLRNNLYFFMKKELENWVISILNSTGAFTTRHLVLSLSWDCFIYCIHSYRKFDVPLGFHFYRNSRFCILRQNRVKKTQAAIIYKDVDICVDSVDAGKFLDLKMFVEYIPERYKPIFKDALMSMNHGTRARSNENWDKETMRYLEYKSVKQILVSVISYLVK